MVNINSENENEGDHNGNYYMDGNHRNYDNQCFYICCFIINKFGHSVIRTAMEILQYQYTR